MQAEIRGLQIGHDDWRQGPAVLFIYDYLLDRQMWKDQVEPLLLLDFESVQLICVSKT